MLLISSLLISASGGHDGHGHHDYDDCSMSTNKVTACEGSVLRLSCPERSKIKILAASYGRADKKTCTRNHPRNLIKCHSSKSLPVVSTGCNGRESCSIPATNSVFSDPCVGTYKYLTIKYCCRRRRS